MSVGNEIDVPIGQLTRGNTKSCGCLKSSAGEELIGKILSLYDIPFTQEQKFDTCIFPDTNRLARFDFFIESSYLIEYDGEQHFKSKASGWNTEEHFQKTIEHDNIKNNWCKENNIPLIRIPYTRYKDLCIEDLLLETSQYIVNR